MGYELSTDFYFVEYTIDRFKGFYMGGIVGLVGFVGLGWGPMDPLM